MDSLKSYQVGVKRDGVDGENEGVGDMSLCSVTCLLGIRHTSESYGIRQNHVYAS